MGRRDLDVTERQKFLCLSSFASFKMNFESQVPV